MREAASVLVQFRELLKDLDSAEQLLEASAAAAKILTNFENTPRDVVTHSMLAFSGSVLVGYALCAANESLAADRATDAEINEFFDILEHVSDRAHVAAELIRQRRAQERVHGVPLTAVPAAEAARRVVLFVTEEGEAVDGFELLPTNAPGSSGVN